MKYFKHWPNWMIIIEMASFLIKSMFFDTITGQIPAIILKGTCSFCLGVILARGVK